MKNERVRLSIPAKAEFLVTARLVAASVAGKAGFDMEDVEDIKTACSEACLLLIPHTAGTDEMQMEFFLEADGLYANISAPRSVEQNGDIQESEFGGYLLEALTDEAEFSTEDGRGEYRLFKGYTEK
ncbi:ATP-binding protein [Christensenellaceae bacterium OttesenSCG-928-M15]|nr:ATP-binding protein [Christensenellaceae bacterium OttesenSCG-928-M15]